MPLSDETKRCVYCDCARQELFSAMPLDYSGNKSYIISACAGCGHGVTESVSDDIRYDRTLYEKGNYDVKEKFWRVWLKSFLNLLERRKLRYLRGCVAGRSVLEIGCGKGRFLKVAKERGLEVYGIEPSERSGEFAKKQLGDVVFKTTIEDMDKIVELKRSFNFIVLWHVLEHLEKPAQSISKLEKHLGEGGLFVLAVPNFSSFQARFGKKNWYHLDPPRHLHHFTPESIKILLERQGFEIDAICFDDLWQNFAGEMNTVTNMLLPFKNVFFNTIRLNGDYLEKTGILVAAVMFLSVFFLIPVLSVPVFVWTLTTQRLKKSGTMVVVARRS